MTIRRLASVVVQDWSFGRSRTPILRGLALAMLHQYVLLSAFELVFARVTATFGFARSVACSRFVLYRSGRPFSSAAGTPENSLGTGSGADAPTTAWGSTGPYDLLAVDGSGIEPIPVDSSCDGLGERVNGLQTHYYRDTVRALVLELEQGGGAECTKGTTAWPCPSTLSHLASISSP